MKKAILMVLSAFPFLIGLTAFSAERGIQLTVKTKSGEELPLYKGSYALVVGNGDYSKGWDPLPGALRDVQEVETALKRNGFNVILKKNLSKDDFMRVFSEFVRRWGEEERARLLFYYAGHGHTQRMATDEELGYIVMVDAPDPKQDPVGFDMAAVDMQTLITQAKLIKAVHVLFMFDSCFSGTILNLRARVNPETIADNVRYPVRQFITAGRAGEPVPDHSVFKQTFLDILEGRDCEPIPDGYLTGEELGLYLKTKVPSYNKTQHPQYGKIADPKLDKGDFVFELCSSEAVIEGPERTETGGTLAATNVTPLKDDKKRTLRIVDASIQRPDREKAAKNPIFQHEDEVQIAVSVNEEAFIHMFSVDQNSNIQKLFPNEYAKNNILPAHQQFIFPNDSQRASGITIRASVLEGFDTSMESLVIVATKEKVEFLADKTPIHPTMADLTKELSEIDLSLWAERIIGYEVVR